ncbi:MAG: AsmA-like C-terminal domain-containing protein [Proteobacteria bacterium]|nr:AsmA-like C-terminal domain-containing protein [Pseudomonadota bacterium]MDA1058165.1 AsmA-like C-terminal domain-containing protein [Pseudomonadota bacterium]
MLLASKIALRLMAALFAGSVIVVAAAAWRLSEGPISVGFLSPYIKESLNFGGADVDIALADTVLAWRGFDRGLDIVVLGLALQDESGQTVARVPELAVGLDSGRLFAGDFVPTTVDVVGANINLRRSADGVIEIGVGRGRGGSASLLAFLRDLTLAPDPRRPGSALRRVSILSAAVTFEDMASGVTWDMPAADLILNRDTVGLSGDLIFDLDLEGQLTHFVATASFDYVGRATKVALDFKDLDPQRLAAKDPLLAGLDRLQLPVTGRINFEVSERGRFDSINFDITAGGGALDLAPVFDTPSRVGRLTARGAVVVADKALVFDELVLERESATAILQGRIVAEEGGPKVIMAGRVAGFTPSDIEEYWPTSFAPPVHKWFTENIKEGVVTEGTVRLNVGPEQLSGGALPDDAVEARLSVSGVTASFFGSLPPITGGEGALRLTGDNVDLELSAGRLGTLLLQEGSIKLVEAAPRIWDASLEFVASGENPEVLRIIDAEPLKLTQRFGMTPDRVRGVSATRVRLSFPMRRGITLADVRFAAASNIRDAAIDKAFGDLDLTQGNLTLDVTKAGMQADGTIALNNVPLGVVWRETFQPEDNATTALQISGRLDDAARNALGFPTGDYIVGEIGAEVDIRSAGRTLLEAGFKIDLTSALVDAGVLRVAKLPTQAATASFLVRPLENGGTRIERAAFNSDALTATGVVELGPERALRRIDLSRLAFGRTEVAASIRPRAPNGFIVAINGPQIDAGPFLDAFFDQTTGDVPPLNVSITTNVMILSERRSLHNVTSEFNFVDQLESLRAAGSINNQAPLSATLVTTPEGPRRLTIAGANAGALARTTGLFDDAQGGALLVSASLRETDTGPVIDGRMEITDLHVKSSSSFARVLTLASLTGLLEVLNGDGLRFARADVPFRFHDGLLEVIDARAFGPSLGITLDGEINSDADDISMFGTLIPAYTINSVLGEIPLIGSLLVGGEGQGLFALTYGIRGPIDRPVITVNPLTALAPGFLRNFFAIFTGDGRPDPADPDRPFLADQPG